MRVGIVMPIYNAEAHLAEAVASVREQTEAAWRLVLVDNGSTDDTPAIAGRAAAGDARIELLHEGRRGPSAARNRALRHLAGKVDYIAFLDADDRWQPEALEVLLECVEADTAAVGAHAMFYAMDGNGSPIPNPAQPEACVRRYGHRGCWPVPLADDAPTAFIDQVVQNNIPIQASIVRMKHALADGGFDEELTGFEDWDYWLRLTRRGHMAYVNRLVTGYRRHAGSLSNQAGTMEACRLKALGKLFRSLPPEGSERERARTAFAAGEILCARRRLRDAVVSFRRGDRRTSRTNARHAREHLLRSILRRPAGF